MKQLTDQHINQLLTTPGLSLVFMTAGWDGNGVILRSILAGLASEYRAVGFFEADYESNPRLCRLFNLLSPPGVALLRDGELLHRVTGPVSAVQIGRLLQDAA